MYKIIAFVAIAILVIYFIAVQDLGGAKVGSSDEKHFSALQQKDEEIVKLQAEIKALKREKSPTLQADATRIAADTTSNSPVVSPMPSSIAPAQAVKPISRRYLQRARLQESCPHLTATRNNVVRVSSDICELLPFLEAYADECTTVVEAGSRHGSSTTALLNRHLPHFASLDLKVTEELATLHRYHKKCTGGDQASQAKLVEGDDIVTGLPFPSTELLFIDTLHNANQLYKELQVFPANVTKWIAFHDSHSYTHHDEASGTKRQDVPPEVSQWAGLKKPIMEFLKSNINWTEEMNYVHNNGLLVLRRKDSSFALKIRSPYNPMRRQIIMENAKQKKMGSASAVANFLALHVGGSYDGVCKASYSAMSNGKAPQMLCDLLLNRDMQSEVAAMAAMVSISDEIYLFNKVSLISGYTIAAKGNVAVVLHPKQQKMAAVDGAVETAALHSAISAKSREKKSIEVVLCYQHEEGCDQDTGSYHELMKVSNRLYDEASSVVKVSSSPVDAELVIVTAATLQAFDQSEAFRKPRRILVFGTNMADVTKYQPVGYSLQTVFNEGMGMAVFEQDGNQVGHYIG